MHQSSQSCLKKSPQYLLATTPSSLLCEASKQKKRTKIVCTIGPKCSTPQSVGRLIDQGMNVARLNFSHGDHESQRLQMMAVKEAAAARGCEISILLDTKGPEIRTGNNATKELIELKAGQLLEITTDYTLQGTSARIACSYKDLPVSTQVGAKILIADGSVSTKVVKIGKDIVTVEVLNDGKIGSKKNMCLPGTVLTLPTIGPNDEKDIVEFGLKYKVDYIAISFSRYKKDLDNLRKLLIEKDPIHGSKIQFISKIENHQGVTNIDEIIDGSDGIMVARGDLGMEVPLEKVVVLQKYITERTINAGKVVITATQMLESMETKPRPTRAEVSDITNSVYDLADSNMTSGETANGMFPVQTVRYMRLISQEAQATCDYKRQFEQRKSTIKDTTAVGIVSLSFELDCHFILLESNDIQFIHRLSTLRPKAYLIVFSDDFATKGAVGVDFGVYTYQTQKQEDPNFYQSLKLSFALINVDRLRILKVEMKEGKFCGTKFVEVGSHL